MPIRILSVLVRNMEGLSAACKKKDCTTVFIPKQDTFGSHRGPPWKSMLDSFETANMRVDGS